MQDPHNNGCLPCVATDECSDSGNAPKIHKVGQFGKIRDPGMGAFNHSEPVRNKSALQNQIRMIKEEIYANGPVQSCFVFPANFQQFFNEHPLGIYNTTKGQNITGSHCVALTGWGRDADSGLDYWIIRNRYGVLVWHHLLVGRRVCNAKTIRCVALVFFTTAAFF